MDANQDRIFQHLYTVLKFENPRLQLLQGLKVYRGTYQGDQTNHFDFFFALMEALDSQRDTKEMREGKRLLQYIIEKRIDYLLNHLF